MTPQQQFSWDLAVNALVAFGTISLAVIAVWGDRLRRLVFPPRLRLGVLSPEGESARVGEDRRPARFYHLKISNARRWSPATQVQVYLLRVETPRGDGQLRLVWDGNVPIRWRHQEVHPLARDIGPAVDCDLCSAVRHSDHVIPNQLRLYPLVTPHTLTDVYSEATELYLTFQAKSVEADSELLRVKIFWNGQWADGEKEMADNLVVTEVSG